MVGISNGGLYVRSYAAEYPQEVAGMVLAATTSLEGLEDIKGLPSGIFVAMGRVGLFRLFPEIMCPGTACDQAAKPMISAFRGRASLFQTYDAEWASLKSPEALTVLRERLSVAGSLGNSPLVILSANQSGLPESEMPASYRQILANEREALTSLSSNHRYVLVMSGHGLDIEHPDLVIAAVNDVIASTRSGEPLAR
jgi:pimeloyl-ACP methyl ester carboxylesterase